MMRYKFSSFNTNIYQFIPVADAKKGGFIFTLTLLLAGLGAARLSCKGWCKDAAEIATAVNKVKQRIIHF